MNFWGDLVRNLREEQGVSQRVLAARTGVGRSALRRLEINGDTADIGVVEKLLHYLGYQLEAIHRDNKSNVFLDQLHGEKDRKQRSRIALHHLLSI